jgi:hypothetical protein
VAEAPDIHATNSSREDANATSHTVALPSGIVSGEILFVFFVNVQGSPTTQPAGWSMPFSAQHDGTHRESLIWKFADGSEGASITVLTSSGDVSGHWSARIGNVEAGTDTVVFTTAQQVGTRFPNPPSLTVPWGLQPNLWLAMYGASGNDSDASAFPANYTYAPAGTNLPFTQKFADGTLKEGGMAVVARQLEAETEDPGSFTVVTLNNRAPQSATVSILPWTPRVTTF